MASDAKVPRPFEVRNPANTSEVIVKCQDSGVNDANGAIERPPPYTPQGAIGNIRSCVAQC